MNNQIYLTSPTLKVTKILKKTNAKHFKELKIGDEFQIRSKLSRVGRNGNSLYATNLEFSKNSGEFVKTFHTYNTIEKYLVCFELVEV